MPPLYKRPAYWGQGGGGKRLRYTPRRWATTRRLQAPTNGYQRTGGYYGRFDLGGAYSRLRRGAALRTGDIEKKFHDVALSAAATTTFAVSTSQNLIAQALTENGRVGRKIVIKDIHCNGYFQLAPDNNSAVAPAMGKVRCMLVQDTQCNGANPVANDVVESSTDINTFNNLANRGRFRTLYEFEDVVGPTGGAGGQLAEAENDWTGDMKIFNLHKKVHIPIEFDAITGVITAIKSNNIFWMYARNTTGGIMTYQVATRMRFIDA